MGALPVGLPHDLDLHRPRDGHRWRLPAVAWGAEIGPPALIGPGGGLSTHAEQLERVPSASANARAAASFICCGFSAAFPVTAAVAVARVTTIESAATAAIAATPAGRRAFHGHRRVLIGPLHCRGAVDSTRGTPGDLRPLLRLEKHLLRRLGGRVRVGRRAVQWQAGGQGWAAALAHRRTLRRRVRFLRRLEAGRDRQPERLHERGGLPSLEAEALHRLHVRR